MLTEFMEFLCFAAQTQSPQFSNGRPVIKISNRPAVRCWMWKHALARFGSSEFKWFSYKPLKIPIKIGLRLAGLILADPLYDSEIWLSEVIGSWCGRPPILSVLRGLENIENWWREHNFYTMGVCKLDDGREGGVQKFVEFCWRN